MSELEVSVATFLPTQPTQTNNTGTAGPYAISFTTYSQCNNVSFSFQSTGGFIQYVGKRVNLIFCQNNICEKHRT